jgi:hypothetical protein
VAEKLAQGMAVKRLPPSWACRRKPSTFIALTCWKSWASATTSSWRAACSIAGNEAFFSRLLSVVGCCFIFSAAWFCLWSISLHLVERPDLAVLLFPLWPASWPDAAVPARLLAGSAGR